MKLASPLLKPTTVGSRVASASVASHDLAGGRLAVDGDAGARLRREADHVVLLQLHHADLRRTDGQARAVVGAGADAGVAALEPMHAHEREPAVRLGQALHALHAPGLDAVFVGELGGLLARGALRFLRRSV
jgi:hypothetical protein